MVGFRKLSERIRPKISISKYARHIIEAKIQIEIEILKLNLKIKSVIKTKKNVDTVPAMKPPIDFWDFWNLFKGNCLPTMLAIASLIVLIETMRKTSALEPIKNGSHAMTNIGAEVKLAISVGCKEFSNHLVANLPNSLNLCNLNKSARLTTHNKCINITNHV